MPVVRSIDKNNLPYWMTQGNPYGTEPIDFRTLTFQAGGTTTPGTVPGTPPGGLPGAPGTDGSPAAGRKLVVPDPTTTASNALAGNLANLAKLRELFNKTSTTLGITPEMRASTGGLIKELQNAPSFLGAYPDLSRKTAEFGTGQGISGSPAETTLGYRLTDEERLRRRVMAEKLQSDVITRGNETLPLKNFMQTPEGRQFWQNLANTVAAAPDPEAAFKRALDLIKQGLSRGLGAGYGGGPPGTTAPTTTRTPSTTPGTHPAFWPTLPGAATPPPPAGGPPSVTAPPRNMDTVDDWLASLGLGTGQPGVTTRPTGDFIGDINPGTDWYA